VNVRLQRMRK